MKPRALVLLIAITAVLVLSTALPAAASCMAVTEAQATAAADVIFEGEALPGGTTGFRGGLTAPYRFRVDRYLKGSGPIGEITVHSGPFVDGIHYDSPQVNSGSSVDLFVTAGGHWVIFANRLADGSLNTFACSGSHLSGEAGPFYEPPPPKTPTAWGAAAVGVGGLAIVMAIGAWIAARTSQAR